MNKNYLQLGNGKWISKAECEQVKEELVNDVLAHWDEFTSMLTPSQKKSLIQDR